MILNTYEAAATLTVGTDAFRNERQNVSSRNRVMRGVAIVGGNAINEAEIGIYIEDYFVGNFRNTLNGAVQVRANQDIFPVGPYAIPAGSKISGIVNVAPTVSPLVIQIH